MQQDHHGAAGGRALYLDGTTVVGALAGGSACSGDGSACPPGASTDGTGRSGAETTGQASADFPGSGRASGGRDRGALPGGRTAQGDGERTAERAAGACVSRPPGHGTNPAPVYDQQRGGTRSPDQRHRAIG